ncbi:MAG TPA: tetratricopeptide repeat protein [Xanthobacteraceae bacterium]|nr:tetratricopeptide repeat protein [Xanthobacteraceae bacterium]
MPDDIERAIALQRQGNARGAVALLEAVLRAQPANADALYYLALAHCQCGELAAGIEAVRRAIALAPDRAAAHNLLGMALSRLGQAREALASFDRAIALQGDLAAAHGNRAGALADLGLPEPALQAYARALELDPRSFPDWINRAALETALRRHADAVVSYDRALAIEPNHPDVHFSRANALRALGRNAAAMAAYAHAIAARPNFAPALHARARLQIENRDLQAALQDLTRAVEIEPSNAAAWRDRALVLLDLGRFADALLSIDRARGSEPENGTNQLVRALALFNLARDEQALATLDRVVSLRPQDARAQAERAAVLNALERTDAAFGALETALALDRANPHVAGIAGDVYLLRGRWREGWPFYERRFEIEPGGMLATTGVTQLPRWRGEPPDGRPLLLISEQGLGDAIEFARFAPELQRLGHRVVIFTAPVLAPLLASVAGVEKVVSSVDELARLGNLRWAPFLSVPASLQVTVETLPAKVPYLKVEPERIERWRARLGGGFKVGIAWQGNPNFRFDRGRSIPLGAFAPLAAISGIRLVSLQKDPGAEQIASVPFGREIVVPADPAERGPEALLDLAAIMSVLDLVVTSDSMPAHLAGALAIPTLVALRRRMLDWRWLPQFADRSPFYPTLKLYRQTVEGDWSPVFAAIAAEVEAHRAAAGR